jgi:hypothetical protein
MCLCLGLQSNKKFSGVSKFRRLQNDWARRERRETIQVVR